MKEKKSPNVSRFTKAFKDVWKRLGTREEEEKIVQELLAETAKIKYEPAKPHIYSIDDIYEFGQWYHKNKAKNNDNYMHELYDEKRFFELRAEYEQQNKNS